MKNLNNKAIRHLKGLAHDLTAPIIVGQNGVTDTLIKGLNEALDHHELLKVKFNDFKSEKKELTARMAEQTGACVISLIGNVATLYKQQEDEEKRKINLPET